MSATRARSKQEIITEMLAHGVVMIHLDARHPDVRVPPQFKERTSLVLSVSTRFDRRDLEISEWGLRLTLSFSGVDFYSEVPWGAIYAARNETDEVWVWDDSFPHGAPHELASTPQDPETKRKVYPKLRLVK